MTPAIKCIWVILALTAGAIATCTSLRMGDAGWKYTHFDVNSRWRINIAMDQTSEPVLDTVLGLRVIDKRRKSQHQEGRTRYLNIGFAYPEEYETHRIGDSQVYFIVGTAHSRINSFSCLWLFDSKTGALKFIAMDLLNLDTRKASRGQILEQGSSQYIDARPKMQMLERIWTVDTKKLRATTTEWRIAKS